MPHGVELSLLYRSEVKKIRTPADDNLRANPPSDPPPQEPPSNPDDEKHVEFVKGQEGDDVVTIGFDPTKLIGRSYLGEPDADGALRRKKITELVENTRDNSNKILHESNLNLSRMPRELS